MSPAPHPSHRFRRRVAGIAGGCAAAALVLAACADAVDGSGTGANPIVSTSPTPSGSSATAFPSGSSTPSGSGSASVPTGVPSASSASLTVSTPTPTPTGSPSAGNGGTCTGADYCDGFSDPTSGWDTTSESDYTLGYSTRGGGSYKIQSRYDGVIYSTAPIDVTSFAPDYDIRVDADAAMVTGGAAPEVGLRCWGHKATNGGNAGFSAYLSPTTAAITLRTEAGKIVSLKSKTVSDGLPLDGTTVHIALACVLTKTSSGTVVADIAFAVNGKVQLETTYSRVAKNYKWNTGKDVGLLLGDEGALGYFDNVAITHIKS